MGTKLSVIRDATTIASSVTTVLNKIEPYYDTRIERRAGNKLGYSLQTINNARQLIDILDFNERDLQRAEALIDAFTYVAYKDIFNT